MRQQIIVLKEFAVDVGEKPKETMSYAQVVSLFKSTMLKVWGTGVTTHGLNDKMTYFFEDPPKSKTLAAVVYKSQPLPKAMSSALLRTSSYYKAYISPRLLFEPKKLIDQVVTHEVIHIGYPHHDKHFAYMCKKHGTFSSENAMRGGKVKVQEKRGKRYYDLDKTFDDFESAEKWARAQIKWSSDINAKRRKEGKEPFPPRKLRLIG